MTTTLTPGARRILEVASELFYARGIHAVGVDTIAAESGVTKRTLYDRFGSKDELVAAYLRARDERWRERVTAAVEAETDPVRRALAPFAVLESWMVDAERGCAFVNAYAELDRADHPGRAVIDDEKRWLRELFATELARAGLTDPDLALQLLVLHEGAMVAYAAAATPDAPRVATAAARALVESAARS
ncbi:TetR/AcrR family transcriptional regulator [Actinomycetospora lemnae]|uniref:Helix-turn-helix domain containing protein n=1 Tax=Actinomycetospora lemnae TaxID=3019891 RepID=A0ABT5T026_9PSEU|nr:TetR/AcrR family transcriptional regulator [Actinomycetospora sp. DW7H6]MDD7967577.1 helix-turn-helix domain containing protein [Actinomycetospora sp. DW7H6]